MKKRLLVILAHPDDAELSCYGTIRKYLADGWECQITVVTDGRRGGNNRLIETYAAFADIDARINCLGFEDGNIQFCIDLISRIRNEIEMYAPNCIITHFPENSGIEHQDHVVVGKAVVNSVLRYSGSVEKVLFTEPLFISCTGFIANYFVDITHWYQNKLQALSKHISQKEKFYINDIYSGIRAYKHSALLMHKDMGRSYEAFQVFLMVEN